LTRRGKSKFESGDAAMRRDHRHRCRDRSRCARGRTGPDHAAFFSTVGDAK
jgi:hypothetical protein